MYADLLRGPGGIGAAIGLAEGEADASVASIDRLTAELAAAVLRDDAAEAARLEAEIDAARRRLDRAELAAATLRGRRPGAAPGAAP